MAANAQAELLEVVTLLQTPVQEDVQEPNFDALPEKVELTKKGSAGSQITAKSLRDQYYEAIRVASQLSKEIRLETFNSFHQKCAARLIDMFYRLPLQILKQAVECAKKRVNISLLNYALSVALRHRDDAVQVNLQIPCHLSTEPGMYFDMGQIREDMRSTEATMQKPGETGNKRYVNIDANYTATDLDPEHKVAYFREDIGLNLHHRHWHEVYPMDAEEQVVRKDRRGELFYYMHQQILARYNFERFSNELPRVAPFSDFREPIAEAYFPKLNQIVGSNEFSSRPANSMLQDLSRDSSFVKIATMERWRERLYDAIDRGYAYVKDPVTKEEYKKKISEETGIDELANSVEAVSLLSWNYQYYGDIHNEGHMLFSYVHDPDNRFQESGGVMSHTETALRDPIFYPWHAFIDEIFQAHKITLPSYTVEQRQFNGVEIEDVKILPQEPKPQNNGDEVDNYHVSNVLKTYWEKDAVDVTQGFPDIALANQTNERIFGVFTHLQHREFEYEIKVKNTRPQDVTGTVRIFLAPHADESGLQMAFNTQRKMFIELDKFTAKLKSNETTTISRKSVESSVTIPFEKTFMTLSDVQQLAKDQKLNEELNAAANGYCGCGWPHHLLIGMGTPGIGLLCDLFVMITNYEEDRVEESPLQQNCCKSSLSYCGVRNNKYPDKKPMGFPFDRQIANVNATINDFMTEKQEDFENQKKRDPALEMPPRLPNMMVVPVRVRHEGGYPKCGKTLKDAGFTEQTAKQFVRSAA